jgi:hypothetical protein
MLPASCLQTRQFSAKQTLDATVIGANRTGVEQAVAKAKGKA